MGVAPAAVQKESAHKHTGKKTRDEVFSLYLYRVLKSMHPNLGMSKKAMSVMNSFIHDFFGRIVSEASKVNTNEATL